MSNDLKERLPQAGSTGTAVERAPDRKPTVAEIIRRAIDTQTPAFKAILPQGDAERFSRLVLTAVKATPKLMEAFGTTQGQTTVLLAAMQCAALGLEPNTPTQDAWLLPRKNKGVMECQLSIGYRGLLKLARRSGIVKSVRADVVREADEFHYEYGLDADVLRHVPYKGDGDPGKLLYAYAVVRFTNGGSQFIVLNRREVEKRRAMSTAWQMSPDSSPWVKWEPEMWCKTAIRALVPYLELDTEANTAIERDERRLHVNDEGVIDVADDDSLGELGAGSPVGEESEAGVSSEQQEAVAHGSEATESVASAGSSSTGSSSGEFVKMSDAQNKALHSLLKRKYGVAGDERFPILMALLDREIASTAEISKDEASSLIDRMNEMADHKPADAE